MRRVNYIDHVSITLHPPHPTSTSLRFIEGPRTIIHTIVDEWTQRAFRSCIVEFATLHKIPAEGGDENRGVMEAWCYAGSNKVKKVEVKVDEDIVGWLQVAKDPDHAPIRYGSYFSGETMQVRGWLASVGRSSVSQD